MNQSTVSNRMSVRPLTREEDRVHRQSSKSTSADTVNLRCDEGGISPQIESDLNDLLEIFYKLLNNLALSYEILR